MILFLYGTDRYRLQEKVQEIKLLQQKKYGSFLSIREVEAKEENFQRFLDEIQQVSMFVRKKVFFVRNPFQVKEFRQGLKENIEKLIKSQDLVVLIEEGMPQKQDELFQLLKQEVKSQEFKPLEGKALRGWVKDYIKKNGGEIEEEGLDLLLSYKDNDLWDLKNEINKLISFTKMVTPGTIRILVQPKVEVGIFETIEALIQKDKRRALALLEKHLNKGDSPLYLLKMITYQFRNLLMAVLVQENGGSLQDLLRLNTAKPYPLRLAWKAARYFSFQQLKKAYNLILNVDIAIKTGRVDSEDALRLLVAQL